MAVMGEISVIAIGTGGPSVGKLVADALGALAAHPNVRYELGAMGTTLTGELNDVLLALTIISATILPITLVTSIYGMNVALPFQHSQHAFTIIIAICVGTLLGFLAYFRYRKWF